MNFLPLVFLILLSGLPTIVAQCGDGTCSSNESPSNCPEDCGLCGNGVCDFDMFEDRIFCPVDCKFYLETFTFGNEYVDWTPASAPGKLDDDGFGDSWLTVTFPARSGTDLNGYFVVDSNDWNDIVATEFRGGFFYYELQINQAASYQATFPDFIIYSAANNAYLYLFFGQQDYQFLDDNLWSSVVVDLEYQFWRYQVGTAQGVDWASGSVSTAANWDSFVGKVDSIWIKGQFSNNGNYITSIDNLQLSPEGAYGICTPTRSCSSVQCGTNGCGDECGTCSSGFVCSDAGTCVQDGCVPSCTGRTCGDNGCGGSCGTCAGGQSCVNGNCATVCTPNCAGRNCGDNGCGGSCGTCTGGQSCVSGVCTCTPNCSGRQCGSNGCGGSCGTCPTGRSCNSAGQCVTFCGDGLCDSTSENVNNCPNDCQICGDGFCNGAETRTSCPADCSNICGNGACEAGETPSNCASDCKGCGDRVCEASRGETVFNCPEDCGTCGDDVCDFDTEDSRLCPEDCGYCGNGVCDADKGENQVSCEVDCGSSVCGDGRCTSGESSQTCPADCVAPTPNTVQIIMNFAGLIPPTDCCTCCGRK